MSRSYKKNPYCTDSSPKTTKQKKRFANKKVRNIDNLPQHSGYKKVYESWDIHDWIYRFTWEEAKKQWESDENEYLKKRYPTLKSYYRYWLKHFKSK